MCLCLSPQAYLRNYTPRIQPFFVHVSYGRQAVVRESLRYVMYFRFYGSRRIARIQPYGPRNAKKDTVAASSGVAMGCAGCAMHKGPAVRGAYSGISFFAFRYRM